MGLQLGVPKHGPSPEGVPALNSYAELFGQPVVADLCPVQSSSWREPCLLLAGARHAAHSEHRSVHLISRCLRHSMPTQPVTRNQESMCHMAEISLLTHVLQPYHLFSPAASQSSQNRARVFHKEGILAVVAAPTQTRRQKQEQKAQETVAACVDSTYKAMFHWLGPRQSVSEAQCWTAQEVLPCLCAPAMRRQPQHTSVTGQMAAAPSAEASLSLCTGQSQSS